MNETLQLLLSLSLSGSILAVLIFAIKPLIRYRLSKSIQYYIWIVVLLRLILPFSFEESIMNNVFDGGQTSPVSTSFQGEGITNQSPVLPNVQENVSNGTYNSDADHSRYFSDLFSRYVFYIWLLGVVIALTVNLTGYTRFLKHLKQAGRPAAVEESRMLADLLNGRKNVRLVRNRFAANPMLIGILRPVIIIPDISYSEKQLKNILLHEVVHLKRFDIGVKWLAMLTASLHWFNPLIYFIKREIDHACELSCDEAVIKNLNAEEKQDYGDTLISVVSENKYPPGVLQATMSEEKETLKERLLAIMKYSKKSKAAVLMSIVLLVAAISGAVMLGGCIGKTNQDVLYENYKFGFSLLIPKDFMDTVEIKEMGDRISFINKEIQAMNPEKNIGIVGRIEAYAKKAEFTRENMKPYEDAYGLRYLGENEKYFFGWAHATDVQYLPDSFHFEEQFRAMEGKFDEMIKSFEIINTSGFNLTNEQEEIKDNFYESVNYDPGQGLLKFTIPKTIPEGYRFYLHVSGRMYMGGRSSGMGFHAFDEETQNYSWKNGKTYTYPLKSDSLDECLLVFGWTDKNNRELLYAIHIYPNGTKSYDDPKKILVFIKNYDDKARMLTFDEIEWVLHSDTKRINDLGLDANLDFPNGYYIYNESELKKSLKVADDVKVYIVNWSDLANPSLTDLNGLTKRMAEYEAPYHLKINEGVIIEIIEQYRP